MSDGKGMNLLDKLMDNTSCQYLSDLHKTSFTRSVLAGVEAMDFSAYTLSVCNEAASYIMNRPVCYDDPEQVKHALCEYLRAN